jgi:CubicO group peptidase (beta-lactamase class C family)
MSGLNEKIEKVINQAIDEKVFPGASVGYILGGATQLLSFGRLTYADNSRLVTPGTLYDAASVTKVIPTNTLILMLLDKGKLKLSDKVAVYLPELTRSDQKEITIWHLLTYTATPKLEFNLSTYSLSVPADILAVVFNAPMMYTPGTKFLYNNTASLWLGMVIERITGERLDVIAARWLFRPLGMSSTTFDVDVSMDVAPTEIDGRGVVQYEPHDETAWALKRQGMVTGIAGLFTTAHDLLRCSEMLLNFGTIEDHRYLSRNLVEMININQIPALEQPTGLGWWLEQPDYFGTEIASTSYGMTGFSGALLLIDPIEKRALVMLCNRTYPTRPHDRSAINAVRRELAGLIMPARPQ